MMYFVLALLMGLASPAFANDREYDFGGANFGGVPDNVCIDFMSSWRFEISQKLGKGKYTIVHSLKHTKLTSPAVLMAKDIYRPGLVGFRIKRTGRTSVVLENGFDAQVDLWKECEAGEPAKADSPQDLSENKRADKERACTDQCDKKYSDSSQVKSAEKCYKGCETKFKN